MCRIIKVLLLPVVDIVAGCHKYQLSSAALSFNWVIDYKSEHVYPSKEIAWSPRWLVRVRGTTVTYVDRNQIKWERETTHRSIQTEKLRNIGPESSRRRKIIKEASIDQERERERDLYLPSVQESHQLRPRCPTNCRVTVSLRLLTRIRTLNN